VACAGTNHPSFLRQAFFLFLRSLPINTGAATPQILPLDRIFCKNPPDCNILNPVMRSEAATVADYLKQLPDDRRAAISTVRGVIRKNLPKGFAETMQYGMITYVVPHKLYPPGYHCDPSLALPFASLASQKNHMALYMMSVYQSPELERWVRDQW